MNLSSDYQMRAFHSSITTIDLNSNYDISIPLHCITCETTDSCPTWVLKFSLVSSQSP